MHPPPLAPNDHNKCYPLNEGSEHDPTWHQHARVRVSWWIGMAQLGPQQQSTDYTT